MGVEVSPRAHERGARRAGSAKAYRPLSTDEAQRFEQPLPACFVCALLMLEAGLPDDVELDLGRKVGLRPEGVDEECQLMKDPASSCCRCRV
jgi:hypothetical protein